MATENDDSFRYVIVNPENGGIIDVVRYGIFNNKVSGSKFFESSDVMPEDHRWVIVVSIMTRKVIKVLGKPMEWTGYVVDFLLNLISLNGGLLNLLANLLLGKTVVIPRRGSETFISTIGHIDGRINLDPSDPFAAENGAFEPRAIQLEPGCKSPMDLSMMASKLAYENATVIKNVVNLHWKMHFVYFYNCWNEYQKKLWYEVVSRFFQKTGSDRLQ